MTSDERLGNAMPAGGGGSSGSDEGAAKARERFVAHFRQHYTLPVRWDDMDGAVRDTADWLLGDGLPLLLEAAGLTAVRYAIGDVFQSKGVEDAVLAIPLGQWAETEAEVARLREALEKIIDVVERTTNSHRKKDYNPYAGCRCAQGYAEAALRPQATESEQK